MKRTIIIKIISYLFIILFLYTAISKLLDYTVFKEQLAVSPILKPIAPFLAWILPVTEALVSYILFVPRWRLRGLYAALIMMVLFTGYISAILLFDDHLPCSCGGIIELLSWKQHLVLNIILIGAALTAVLLYRSVKQSYLSSYSI